MKFKFNEKYNTIAAYFVIVFTICILILLLIFRFDMFWAQFLKIMKILSPIIWGISIAYLLNPLMKKIELILAKLINRKKEHPKTIRALAVFFSSVFTLALIVILISNAIPEIIINLTNVFNMLPNSLNNLYEDIMGYFNDNPKISSTITNSIEEQFEVIKSMLLNWATELKPFLEKTLNMLKDGIFNFLIGLKDFILGFIVSIYILYSKEMFMMQFKKLIYALFPVKSADKIILKSKHTNDVFTNFLSGKLLDSVIIGMICFILMTIFKMPYAILISSIIGITNIIPFFGPFIGAIPASILVLLSEPKKTILFVILILILQQFDGNFLGPKILGNSLKLPTFWIMFSIFLCGGLFGVVGMVIGIPLFAVLCVNMQEFIKTRNYSSNRIADGELERLGFNDEKSSHQKTHVKKPFIKKERKK